MKFKGEIDIKAKLKKIFTIIFLIFIAYIFIFNVLIPIYKNLNPPPTVREFTKEKALEDYDFLWDTLETRYPYFGVVERKLGIDIEDVKRIYRKKIEERSSIDVKLFYQIINEALKEMNYIGHLIVFDANTFFRLKYVLDVDDELVEDYNLTYQRQALEDEKALESYGYMRKGIPLHIFQRIFSWSISSNIKTETIDETTAFLEVFYPSVKNEKRDLQYLLDYFNKLEREGYKHLIIRCHANDSGDFYWMNNIVSPNIDEVKTFHTKSFIKNDEWIKNYYQNLGVKVIEEIDFEEYQNLNTKDAQQFGGYVESGISVEPLFEKKTFSGDIYLLTDSNTFSSIEAFAQFAKGTGFATLVGYQTGGDGYNGGTPMMTALPNSGLVFFYRMGYGINEDGSSNVEFGTLPDVIPEDSETPLQACLRWINEENQ